MHRTYKIISVTLLAALVLFAVSAALAAPAAQDPLPSCVADPVTGKIAGTVIAVDETNGLVTVDPPGEAAPCTVKVTVDETHPIALLLGMYFDDLNQETLQGDLKEALTDARTCATTDGTNWTWVACGTPGAVNIQVTGTNPDGTYTAAVVNEDGSLGTPIASIAISDPPTVERLNGALEDLLVDWTLESDGNLMLASDRIMELHNEGIGFGVLVKLFSIAKASGGAITVEELLAQYQAGMGMGQLFKEYGKPPQVGVGHVRQELKHGDQDSNNPGSEIGKDHGNGYGNGNTPPGQEKKENKPPKDKVKDQDKENKLKGTHYTVPKGHGNHKP